MNPEHHRVRERFLDQLSREIARALRCFTKPPVEDIAVQAMSVAPPGNGHNGRRAHLNADGCAVSTTYLDIAPYAPPKS